MASSNNPPSVADVVAQARHYTYNAQIPLANWLRTASTMQKEALVYAAEGNDAQTYLLLYRHADLVLQKLQGHPDRNMPEIRKALGAATTTVSSDLKKLEEIAPRIKRRHDEYQERRGQQLEALKLLDARAQENHSLAARLAQREVRRRDTARSSVRQHGVSDVEEQERRTAGRWDSWPEELARQGSRSDDLSSQLQDMSRLQHNGDHGVSHAPSQSASATSTSTAYHYPSVPHTTAQDRWDQASAPYASHPVPARPPKEQIYRSSGTPSAPPPRPPKPPASIQNIRFGHPRPPPLPSKFFQSNGSSPPVPGKTADQRPATPSSELDDFTFQPSAFLENGEPLRPVFLPAQLRNQFLVAASSNTRLNLETCGMLCGILKSNALFITRLIVPEQTSTSDTCETLNEEELFDYCDKEELLVIGWIHTHPTQTCFMSSRDLHTHVGYQVMMPESIAIVCAPSKVPSWGCFRLTDPPGKQAILSCSRPGIFHPHDVDNIYTEALKPGHVVELTNAPLEIVDMRPKRTLFAS